MNQPKSQPKISPNDAAGNLGFVNTMHEQLLQYKGKQAGVQPTQSSPNPQNAPGQEQKENPQIEKVETNILTEIEGIKKQLEEMKPKDKNKELDDLKKEIEQVLAESDDSNAK